MAITVGMKILSFKNIFAKSYAIFFIFFQIFIIIVIYSHYFMDIYGAITTYFMLRYFYDKFIEQN